MLNEDLKEFALEDEALEDIAGGLTPKIPDNIKIMGSVNTDVNATSPM